MDSLLAQLKREWIREDWKYLAYFQKMLLEFEALYLKYFYKSLNRQVNRMVIEYIVSEIDRLKEQLFPVKSDVVYKIVSKVEVKDGFEGDRHPADSRSLEYCLA